MEQLSYEQTIPNQVNDSLKSISLPAAEFLVSLGVADGRPNDGLICIKADNSGTTDDETGTTEDAMDEEDKQKNEAGGEEIVNLY